MFYKRLTQTLLFFFVILSLVACETKIENGKTDLEILNEAKEVLEVEFTVLSDSSVSVTGDLNLPIALNDIQIRWESDNQDVVSLNGTVKRLEVDTSVKLTAFLTLNNATGYKVFYINVVAYIPVIDIDYGDVTIDDIVLIINSNRISTYTVINPKFTKDDLKEKLTYTIVEGDSRALVFDNDDMVIARQMENATLKVKAESNNFLTYFNIDVVYHNYNDPDFDLYSKFNTTRFDVNGKRIKLMDLDLTDYTVVIGDSFTDDIFIGDFLKPFEETQYIISAGIGSTTSFHWEAAFVHIIGQTAPKNIVLNIGTNNLYGGQDSVEDVVSSIQRLFMYMHTKYPETNIYYWGISQRSNTTYYNEVILVNEFLKTYIETKDYITFVDAKITNADIYDGIHPNHQGYTKMFNALNLSGIEVVNK